MPKVKLKNLERGARGVWNEGGELVMIEAGQSAEIEVSAEELKDLKANRQFAINGKRPKGSDEDELEDEDLKPASVLDQGVAGLKKHLATVESVDELNELGKQEAANANRTTALDAIQARIDELEKAPA
jgi:hypothetical protein